MKRWFASLAVLILTAPLAQAHFIWIVPDKDGGTFQVVFSDGPRPDDPKLLPRIAKTDVRALTANSQPARVQWSEGKEAYLLTRPADATWQGLAAVCRYGVTQRGKAEPFLLNYYARCNLTGKGEDQASDLLPLQILRLDRTRFQVTWQGKPLPDAEVSIETPGEDKGTETKTDAKGIVTVAAAKTGLHGLRARHVEAKAGDLDGKAYKEVRHYSTLVAHLEGVAKSDAKADPAATKLLAEARANRAVWKDFPGFSADIEVNFDGKSSKGKVLVSAGGKDVSLEGIDKSMEPWARRELESIVNHRLPGVNRETPCAFVDEVENHPLGRAIRVLNDELHSSYRVRGNEIVVVNRTTKDRRFTITVLESITNAEGKFLTTSYVVDWWNLETGDLVRNDAASQTWKRVGAFDLPATTRAVAARGKSFAGETAKEDAYTGKSLSLTNHQLLESKK